MMHLQIDHITRYTYSEPATGIVQVLKLTPQDSDSLQVLQWRIDTDVNGRMSATRDEHGNICHYFYVDEAVDSLTLHVSGAVLTTDTGGIISGGDDRLPPMIYRRSTPLTLATPALVEFAECNRQADQLNSLHTLMMAVHKRMRFQPGMTDGTTTADTAFTLGYGVCQDLAQVFIALARHQGIPARYVSGHYALPEHPEQEAAHAWAEAWVDNLGWVAFDPTHGVCATEGHVRVAVGLDSLDAAPVRGSRRGGGAESLVVGVHGREKLPRVLPVQTRFQSQA